MRINHSSSKEQGQLVGPGQSRPSLNKGDVVRVDCDHYGRCQRLNKNSPLRRSLWLRRAFSSDVACESEDCGHPTSFSDDLVFSDRTSLPVSTLVYRIIVDVLLSYALGFISNNNLISLQEKRPLALCQSGRYRRFVAPPKTLFSEE